MWWHAAHCALVLAKPEPNDLSPTHEHGQQGPHGPQSHQGQQQGHWATSGERSSRWALRLMAFVAVRVGRPAARLLLWPIALYFFCFAPTVRKNAQRFFTRAMGRPPSAAERFAQVHAFASIVLDRVYFARGAMHEFDLQVVGGEQVDASLAVGQGVYLVGAHMGSFEALHAVGATRPGMKVALAMYPDNAQKVQSVLASVAPDLRLSIIAIGRPGASLAIRDWLAANGLVGILADRFLPSEHERNAPLMLPFLGSPAAFSDGPFRLAQALKARVLFMVGLYRGGRRYEVRFCELADFRPDSALPPLSPAQRQSQLQAALQRYVQTLEALAREAPNNWFNFYDFWQDDAQHPPIER